MDPVITSAIVSGALDKSEQIGNAVKSAGEGAATVTTSVGEAGREWQKGKATVTDAEGRATAAVVDAQGRARSEELRAKNEILKTLSPEERTKLIEQGFLNPSPIPDSTSGTSSSPVGLGVAATIAEQFAKRKKPWVIRAIDGKNAGKTWEL